ncbi:hypothetical protein [Desulforhabdus sp. TSK]|uniref:hypothetical protein n=1 Tax=Desulforhabdus sp. TSK TaxID=2925014 RepID=UPI001FC83E07|nr:hypothetical protein [Desulforhabdus sp. TSK]GKT07684.1 hypothetical protein DSTSK_09890 [Desulforhabdus sp. TSK]
MQGRSEGIGASAIREGRERRKILVLGKGETFSRDVMDYAVLLAERLDFDIIALNVAASLRGNLDSQEERKRREAFVKQALVGGRTFQSRAAQTAIECEHAIKFGDILSAIEEVSQKVKRIEFVVTDSDADRTEIVGDVSIPVFSLMSNHFNPKGEKTMASVSNVGRKNLALKTAGFGALTVAMYAAVFAKADVVMHLFTQGGWHAALPVTTVLAFSFIHGAFASNLWSLLGIQARDRHSLHKTDKATLQKKKQATKRPRVYAYVNPFHRL